MTLTPSTACQGVELIKRPCMLHIVVIPMLKMKSIVSSTIASLAVFAHLALLFILTLPVSESNIEVNLVSQ